MIRIISLLIVVVVISGCSSYATNWSPSYVDKFEHEKTALRSQLEADIWLDCGEHKLGAYTIELGYNPNIIEVSEIKTARENAFPGTPMSNPSTFKSGKTVIIGMYTGKDIPNNRIKIAHVAFLPVSIGTSPLKVILQSVYDTDSNPFDASAIISPASLTVTK